MSDPVLWDIWWTELLSHSTSLFIEDLIEENINLYQEYYDMGWTPEMAYEEEFG